MFMLIVCHFRQIKYKHYLCNQVKFSKNIYYGHIKSYSGVFWNAELKKTMGKWFNMCFIELFA
jgi:hypothetical protein